jgi:hypothetical protein
MSAERCAIRASVSEASANPGMGTRCIHLHVLLLSHNLHFYDVFVAAQATAECTTARTFGKVRHSHSFPFYQRPHLVQKKSGQCFHHRHLIPRSMCNNCTWQLVSAHLPIPSILCCHTVRHRVAPHPFINDTVRTRRGFINGRYEPLTTGARMPPVLRR